MNTDIDERPTSVSVIAWILIVASGVNLANAIRQFMKPEIQQLLKTLDMPLSIVLLWAVVSGVIGVVSGIAILKGLNWGRLLYLYSAPISIVLTLLLVGFRPRHISVVTFYIVVLVFLTRPVASAFFVSRKAKS